MLLLARSRPRSNLSTRFNPEIRLLLLLKKRNPTRSTVPRLQSNRTQRQRGERRITIHDVTFREPLQDILPERDLFEETDLRGRTNDLVGEIDLNGRNKLRHASYKQMCGGWSACLARA